MGNLIWLASYPKSGNTWLRAFLHNLLRNPEAPFDINKLGAFCLGESMAHWYKEFDPRPASQFSLGDVAKMRPKVHRAMTRSSPDNVFVKTHNALVADFGVPLVTPEVTAGMICIVRNPLDIAVSYSHHMGTSLDNTITWMATPGARTLNSDEWVTERMGSWSEHVASWTTRPLPALHVVRYEDMQIEPFETFAGVARFLGLDPPRERLERAVEMSSFKVLQEQERRHGFREKSAVAERFFRAGAMGQWKAALTQDQVARMVATHRAQMARFGYVPDAF